MMDLLKRGVRQSRSLMQTVEQPEPGTSRIIQPVHNPMFLSDSELQGTLKHFVGKVDARHTHHDLAQQFLMRQDAATSSYKRFKDGFYEYLVSSVNTKFGQCRFNNQLHQCLQPTFSRLASRADNIFHSPSQGTAR